VSRAAALACLGIALLGCPQRDALTDLRKASAAVGRHDGPRLTAFPAALAVTRRRGEETSTSAAELRLHAVAAAAAQRGTPRERAVALLLAGDVQPAVAGLRAAAATGGAAEWNDLAAAGMLLAGKHDDPQEWADALGATTEALARDPRMPEATFNRAVILEALSLAPAARAAFQAYLDLDGGSPWSAEARRHLSALTASRPRTWRNTVPHLRSAALRGAGEEVTALVRNFPQQARTWSEAEFLGAWGSLTLQQKAEAAAAELTVARAIGNSLRRISGESLLGDTVDVIDRSAPDVRLQLAKAHTQYREGRQKYGGGDRAAALPFLESSREAFARAGSPMAGLADYYAANILYDHMQYAGARKRLMRIRAIARSSHRSLLAQNYWLEGLIDVVDGRVDACVEAFDRAKAEFAALGENDNVLEMASRAAGMLAILGKRDEAWHRWPAAFAAASRSDDPSRVQTALSQTALSELRQGKWGVAKAMLDFVISGESDAQPRVRFNALLWRALTFGKMRRTEQADDDLSAARATIVRLDPQLRDRAWSELRRVEAMIVRDRDPRRAAHLLSAKSDDNASNKLWRISELVERAGAERALGDIAGARRDLQEAAGFAEAQRQRIARDDIRDAFFGNANDAFVELTDVLEESGDIDGAFEAAERGRSRLMLDRLHVESAAAAPLSAAAIISALPPSTALFHCTTTDRRLIMFAVRQGTIEAHGPEIPRADVENLIDAMARAVEDDVGPPLATVAERLSSLIFRGAEATLTSSKTLVFVPDDLTSRVVWSLLRDPSTHRLLIEDHRILIAPSASTFLGSIEGQSSRASALIIGDPRLDEGSGLPQLPFAAREAAVIGALYSSRKILTGADATPAAVRNALDGADVLHLATHAVLRSRNPSTSFIALAGTEGEWYLPEIAAQRFKRIRLVVAAGCRTGTRSSGRGDLRSFAGAFLFAGARSVVGSLWDVDDSVTAHFSIAFHRALRAGSDPASALREAQLSMKDSADERLRAPSAWAGFQLYGSGQ
jgi:CHAT domain-containing protein/tetratricopeptide (TPR) repeat protein